MPVIGVERFAERIFITKILFGDILGYDHGIGLLQNSLWVAFNERKSKYIKEGRIGQDDIPFDKSIISAVDDEAGPLDPDKINDFREVVLESRSERGRIAVGSSGTAFGPAFSSKQESPVPVFVKAVIAHLVLDIKEDQDAAGHAHGKAGDVDQGINSVSFDVSQCNF